VSFLTIEVHFEGADPDPILRHSIPGIALGFLVAIKLPPLAVLSILDARQVKVHLVSLADAILDTPPALREQVVTRLLDKGAMILDRATIRRAHTLCTCDRCNHARDTLEKKQNAAENSAATPAPKDDKDTCAEVEKTAESDKRVESVSASDEMPWDGPHVSPLVTEKGEPSEPVLRQYTRTDLPMGGFVADVQTRRPIMHKGEPVRASMLAMLPLHKRVNPRAPRD